jgi:hypothetical protein
MARAYDYTRQQSGGGLGFVPPVAAAAGPGQPRKQAEDPDADATDEDDDEDLDDEDLDDDFDDDDDETDAEDDDVEDTDEKVE